MEKNQSYRQLKDCINVPTLRKPQACPASCTNIGARACFFSGLIPIGKYYFAEITNPTPEGTSNGLIQLFGQASVIFVTVMDQLNIFKIIKETSTI